MGRGRHRRVLGFPPTSVRWCGALEHAGPDSEGTIVRPDQQRRQSRRGCEGAVLLPGRHADALVLEDALQVSTVRLSLLHARGGKPPPWDRATGARTRRLWRLRRG